MKYRHLKHILDNMSEQELDKDVTLYVPGVDEYYPGLVAFTNDDCDVLDPGHPVITIADPQ